MARAQIDRFRAAMAAAGINTFLIPTADPHGSEYPCEHFKAREYMSGFTGSAGTLAVGADWAGLWTDGRYFLQAEQELSGSDIDLYRMGQPGVPELYGLLAEKKGKVGADFATLTAADGREMANKGIELIDAPDIVGGAWENRPPMPQERAYCLDMEYAGVSAQDKLRALREAMAEAGACACVLTALDDIAWLFNIRGNDVEFLPVALCYAVVEADAAYLFMDEDKRADIAEELELCGVSMLDYAEIYPFISRYAGKNVLASPGKLNYRLYLGLSDAVIVEGDPVGSMKAVKNPTELAHSRRVHLEDGVALSRLIHYVKTNSGAGLTELDVCDKLLEYRKEWADFAGLSFATICGYGPNGAIIHYHATPESNQVIEPRGLLLLDSGGQYEGGTTDVTRTISMGPVEAEQKAGFTLVLESMLALMDARFPYGCTGYHLDAIARMPFWENGLDYDHGTGHGVGYMLSVHEGPNGFRWKQTGRSDRAVLEPGMITSDEPGIYIAGSYGVRLENLIECVEGEANAFGRFLRFEPITFAPIDLDAIEPGLLSERGKERLNRYHAQVYEKLAPLMKEEELSWLKEYTRPI